MHDLLMAIIKYILQPHILFILLLGVLVKIYYPKFRGLFGEFWVKQELKKLPEEYIVLDNIMIKSKNKTHQIDHIILSRYGVFVIEMKNYYGLITGNEYDEKWTQYLGKKKYKFLNPIRQNYGHIESLKEIINLKTNQFISIICFSNQAKLNVKSKTKVTQLDFILEEILPYKNVIINDSIPELADKINKANITTNEVKKEHVKTIKKEVKEKEKKTKENICPKCGSKLVERTGKFGDFIGCSNYPNCKYTTQKKEK